METAEQVPFPLSIYSTHESAGMPSQGLELTAELELLGSQPGSPAVEPPSSTSQSGVSAPLSSG
jgi:hypothetical protein